MRGRVLYLKPMRGEGKGYVIRFAEERKEGGDALGYWLTDEHIMKCELPQGLAAAIRDATRNGAMPEVEYSVDVRLYEFDYKTKERLKVPDVKRYCITLQLVAQPQQVRRTA